MGASEDTTRIAPMDAGRLAFVKILPSPGKETSITHNPYRPDIDGLRALSVLLVIGFHAFPQIVPGGFIGVDVFFVISGFLISGIIFSELSARRRFDLSDFYLRRVRRLFPALIAVLLATLCAGWMFLFPRDLAHLGRQTAAAAAFVANLHFWKQSGYFSPNASEIPLLHLWSLGVEEQFYIVWPPLLMLLWRRRSWIGPAIVAIAVASFALNVAYAQHGSFSFYFPAARAWEFMLGAVLAWRPDYRDPSGETARRWREFGGLLGLVLILSAALLLREDAPYPSWRALAPTIGAALTIWSGRDSCIGRKILSAPIAVGLGLISYPLYLWHWPILWLVRVFYPGAGPGIVGTACCAAIIIAWATYVFIERPVRRRFRLAPFRVAASLSAVMALILVAAAFFSLDGLPGRWSDPAVKSLLTYKFDDAPYRLGKCHLELEQGPADFASECFGDNPSASTSAVLWGDSAATAIYPGMRALSDGSANIAELTSSGCPPFLDRSVSQAGRPNCASVNDWVFRYIERTRPEIVILSSWPDYRIDYGKEFLNTIGALKRLGVPTIVLVGPPPLWPEPLPRIILRNYFNGLVRRLPDRVSLTPAALAATSKLDLELTSAAKLSGALYVSAFQRLCTNEGACLAMVDGEPSAWDGFHLTTGSSKLVAKEILDALSRAAAKPGD
jgi:peptidoglycan/LPS O-acetylase OafA/YrhL